MGRAYVTTSVKEGRLRRDRINDVSNWHYLNPETRGMREKFILVDPQCRHTYLFKKPAYGDFEVVTEVFNCILAAELKIRHVQYFPAVYREHYGVICKSFLNPNIAGQELWEMKSLIVRHSTDGSDLLNLKGRSKRALQEHNIENIFMILKAEFGDVVMPRFFQMLGLDILIGHGDRHWENYGVLVNLHEDIHVEFSPIYDTAAGYLTEVTDTAKLKGMLDGELQTDEWYSPKTDKLCKIKLPNDLKSNHFDLLRYVLTESSMKRYRQYTVQGFTNFNPKVVDEILTRFFPRLDFRRRQVIRTILRRRYEIGRQIIEQLQ